MRDDCGVPSWRPCCETGASARLCGGLWGAGSCWHLHVFSVGHVWEADLYPAVSVRVGAARFLNEHLSVNIVCCPVLITENMRATLVLIRCSRIIRLAPFAFCPISVKHTTEHHTLMPTLYSQTTLIKINTT